MSITLYTSNKLEDLGRKFAENNRKIGDVFSGGMSIKGIIALIYSGLLAYDQEEGNEIDYNEFKVGIWLEDFDSEKLNDVVSSMLESRILGNDLNMGINRKVTKTTKVGKSKAD